MSLSFRSAGRDDVPVLVQILAQDRLGAAREAPTDPLPESYYSAFRAIEADPNNEIIIAEQARSIVGFFNSRSFRTLPTRGAGGSLSRVFASGLTFATVA